MRSKQDRSLYKSKKSVCLCICLCVCASNISADQDQTDLRFSTWLLHGLRLCNFGVVWITMIPLINDFINDLPILLALSTIATIVMCAPKPITAHHSHVRTRPITAEPETSGFIPAAAQAGLGLCQHFGTVLCN